MTAALARRDPRRRQRDADAVAHRHELAVHHRAAESLGIEVVFKTVVGDDRDELANSFRSALDRVDLVVCSGGLGPTDDDVTREVVADVLGRPLREDEAITEHIRARFTRRGMQMPEINRRQAMVPAGGVVIENPNGSAPGLVARA